MKSVPMTTAVDEKVKVEEEEEKAVLGELDVMK